MDSIIKAPLKNFCVLGSNDCSEIVPKLFSTGIKSQNGQTHQKPSNFLILKAKRENQPSIKELRFLVLYPC